MHTPKELHRAVKALNLRKRDNPDDYWREVSYVLGLESVCRKMGVLPHWEEHDDLLASLGLPRDLLDLIKHGKLVKEVDKAYSWIDAVNARLDAFEDARPEVAASLPWSKERDKWKQNGRPRLPWWQALLLTERMRQPGK